MIVVPVSFGFLFWIAAFFAALFVFLWLVSLPDAISRSMYRRNARRQREIDDRKIIEARRRRSGS